MDRSRRRIIAAAAIGQRSSIGRRCGRDGRRLTGASDRGAQAEPKPAAAATPTPSPTPTQLLSPFTGEPVKVAWAGTRGQDRQHRVCPAADRMTRRGHRVRAAGGGRPHPVPGDLLVALPAGHRAGAQRQKRTTCSYWASSAARHSRSPAPRASCSRSWSTPGSLTCTPAWSAVTTGTTSGSRPYNLFATTRMLLAESKRASKAHSIGFKFGPAPAGGRRRGRTRFPTRPRSTPSPGRRQRIAGWYRWTARQR